MIQRVQSLHLLLGALCLASLSLLDPVWQSRAAAAWAWYVPAIAILGAITAILAVVAIFLYKDRRKQLKIILLLQTMTIIFMIALYGGLFLAGDLETFSAGAAVLSTVLVLFLPLLAYIFFYLARRGVHRDIDLVKSMDRLR